MVPSATLWVDSQILIYHWHCYMLELLLILLMLLKCFRIQKSQHKNFDKFLIALEVLLSEADLAKLWQKITRRLRKGWLWTKRKELKSGPRHPVSWHKMKERGSGWGAIRFLLINTNYVHLMMGLSQLRKIMRIKVRRNNNQSLRRRRSRGMVHL